MNALEGRQQTTRGIWLEASPKINHPPTIIMDLEGSDGRERGEDDTSFERQSALFALAVADVLLVNMWAKDVGRETGAGKPLLRTIFQVNLKLFQPSPKRHKTVLLFAFRDKTKTPLEKLIETWETDLKRIWDSIAKSPGTEGTQFSDYFEVKYASFSNFEDHPESFCNEAAVLRQKFTPASNTDGNTEEEEEEDGSYLRPVGEKLPGHSLALSMSKVWEVIRTHKDLNLPAHRVMVSEIRCKDLAREALENFVSGTLSLSAADVITPNTWPALSDMAIKEPVESFGAIASALRAAAFTEYDAEAMYFDPEISGQKREDLETSLDGVIKPIYTVQLEMIAGNVLEMFRLHMQIDPAPGETFVHKAEKHSKEVLEQFDASAAGARVQEASFDGDQVRSKLEADLAIYTGEVQEERVTRILSAIEKAAKSSLSVSAVALFEAPPADLWVRLSSLLSQNETKARNELQQVIEGQYTLDAEKLATLNAHLSSALRQQLMTHAKESANTALSRVKERFNQAFQRDENGLPQSWTPETDIPGAATAARRRAAVLLAQLCFARLHCEGDDKKMKTKGDGDSNKATMLNIAQIQDALCKLSDSTSSTTAAKTTTTAAATAVVKGGDFDLLSAAEWPGVDDTDVLLSPNQARSTWRNFVSDSALSVQQALATQEANRAARNRAPPMWAIFAMAVLGFNEAMAVLRNPLLLLLLVLLFLFAKTVYQELDVEGELAKGLLPGLLALSAKFSPVVKKVAFSSFESAMQFMQENAHGHDNGGESPSSQQRNDRNYGGGEMSSSGRGGGGDLRSRKQTGGGGVAMASGNSFSRKED
jgi:protein SEY1